MSTGHGQAQRLQPDRGRDHESNQPGSIDLGSTPGTVLTSNATFIIDTPLYTGAITGTGDLVKSGLATQQLGSGGNFIGTMTVRQGTLEFTNAVPVAGPAIRLGDANFSSLDAVLFNADRSVGGFARPFTVAAGALPHHRTPLRPFLQRLMFSARH